MITDFEILLILFLVSLLSSTGAYIWLANNLKKKLLAIYEQNQELNRQLLENERIYQNQIDAKQNMLRRVHTLAEQLSNSLENTSERIRDLESVPSHSDNMLDRMTSESLRGEINQVIESMRLITSSLDD